MMKAFAVTAVATALSGCATIFNHTTQPVVVTSTPEGAAVTVTNRAGETIRVGTTPVTLTLNRGAGYFKSETYTVSLAKEGFAPKQIVFSGSVSGWYFGNLLVGGVIGMVVVDPLSGAMYTLPDSVTGTLESTATNSSQADGSLTIVSTDSLTPEQLKQARLLTPGTAPRTQ